MLNLCDSKSICAAVSAFMTISVGQPALASWPFNSGEKQFAAACERIMLERLDAPWSYRRISVSEPQFATGILLDMLGWGFPKKKAADLAIADHDARLRQKIGSFYGPHAIELPVIASMVIEYEAENSIGAPSTRSFTCQTVAGHDDTIWPRQRSRIIVDGFTAGEWQAYGQTSQ